ncbi:hypothetical protein [Leisingera aquimarina]|uniref:hypothetical protein n=1 Tax=Leisingera aquimarina TaxID=476529 RepID=UPI0012EC3605|nr:hypothetical protein [Leisingera aquimarina]
MRRNLVRPKDLLQHGERAVPRGNLPPEVHRVRAKLADGSVCFYFSLRGRKGTGFWKDARPFPKVAEFFSAYTAAMEAAQPKTRGQMTEALVMPICSRLNFWL